MFYSPLCCTESLRRTASCELHSILVGRWGRRPNYSLLQMRKLRLKGDQELPANKDQKNVFCSQSGGQTLRQTVTAQGVLSALTLDVQDVKAVRRVGEDFLE